MSEYRNFIEHVKTHNEPIIMCAIPVDKFIHPCASTISLLFIHDTNKKRTTTLSFHHPDYPTIEDKKTVLDDLSKLKNRKWVFDKKSFLQLFPVSELLDLNLYKHLQQNEIYENEKYETNAHRFISSLKRGNKNLNLSIPALKHKESFDMLCKTVLEEMCIVGDLDSGFLRENNIIIETLAELESNGIHVNRDCFTQHFNATVHSNDLVYSQYNIYTSTGRPSNHFENVNYAALNKENGVRRCFTSRYGTDGKIVLVDYSAFHPRIITHLVKFPLAIDVDIYKYLGQLYFKRDGDIDINLAKQLTFRQLYGGVEEQFEHIKYFSRLKEFMNENWKYFQNNGFVKTPMFGRSITNLHLKDANPSKLFNYILQATETEIAISTLQKVLIHLRGKKTKAILYTYDSMMFDLHREDGEKILLEIMEIMKINNKFPIKVYVGDSYETVTQMYA